MARADGGDSGRRSAVRSGDSGSDPAAAEVLAAAREILPWMSEIRRDLHRNPELGLEETRTAGRIQEWLEELGLEHRDGLAGTGVLGYVKGRSPGRVVALRADIDALPLEDAKDVPYRSQIPGKMHACGHDVHTAVLLGAARILAARTERFDGMVKLIFQPAEETVGGAKLMIAEGVLDDPLVEAIFGLHADPEFEVGSFALRYGQRNASSDNIALTVHGRSGHGAYPAGGVDAIVVAAQVVTALQSVVSRSIDARRSAVVTFGTIQGGSQGNILADKVRLVGTIRSLDQETRERVLQRVREVAEGVASAMGGRADLEVDPSYDALINDDAMVEIVRDNAAKLCGPDKIVLVAHANMGVEDFAYYARRAPAAFFSLGARNEAKGIVHPLHSNRFDVDEECLAYGAAMQALNAMAVLGRPK